MLGRHYYQSQYSERAYDGGYSHCHIADISETAQRYAANAARQKYYEGHSKRRTVAYAKN